MKHILNTLFSLVTIFCVQALNGQGTAQVQVNPDCQVLAISLTFTAGSPSTMTLPGGNGFDNRAFACQSYVLEYVATANSGTLTSIAFQAAGGAVTPGSFSNFGGTVSTGINPNTSSTGAITTFATGCASATACTVKNSWLNVVITRNNFVGTIQISAYGWKQGAGGAAGGGGGGGSGCVGTQATPCIVTTACPNEAAVSVSSSGLTQILALSAGKAITVCHISVGFASGVNFQLEYGTGSACAGGTTAATGVYQAVQGIALDVPFTLPASQALCVNLGSGVAGGGLLVYAQQ